jgi:hypothetical protein
MAGRARLSPERERVLAWDGCINVRDLGGLPTEDGRETRFGIVVRADAIRGLTDKGLKALADYGVRLAFGWPRPTPRPSGSAGVESWSRPAG